MLPAVAVDNLDIYKLHSLVPLHASTEYLINNGFCKRVDALEFDIIMHVFENAGV